MTFEQWSNQVNVIFVKITGLDRDSWPDQDYWTMWDAGYTPMEATANAIYNEYDMEGLEAFGLREYWEAVA